MSDFLSEWPIIPNQVRRPRWRISVNEIPMFGCLTLDVHTNNHYRPDEFSATFALNADPNLLTTWTDMNPPITITCEAGFLDPSASEYQLDWNMVFKGEIDSVDNIDLLNGIVSIKGRDLSRRLIDATTRETFTNKKSSDVAKLLASRHNLQADVDNTSVLVGTFYQFEHDKLTHDSLSKTTKEFDLLKFLAQKEGYDFWVSGDTLYFKQPVDQDTAFPFKLIWTGRSQTSAYPYLPATDIRLSRSLTLAKDSKVIVKTWDSKSKKSAEFTYPTSAKADAQQYVFLRPGLTPDQAIKFAQSQYTEIIKHERLVSITMPGELDIDARSIVELVGTNTSFDQRYYVDSIDRQWSQDAGFRQTLNLKNHTTQTQTTVE